MLRIFSKNNDLSCNDYIKNIKGQTILSNLKTNSFNNRSISTNSNKVISYLSYNDFLLITQTFYKFSNLKKKYKPPQKIIDLKTSFLFYNKILNHIQHCDFCKMNSIETNFKNCKGIQNILYPYGEHFTYEIYSNLAEVDLDFWCRKECINEIHCNETNDLFKEINKYSYNQSTSSSENNQSNNQIPQQKTNYSNNISNISKNTNFLEESNIFSNNKNIHNNILKKPLNKIIKYYDSNSRIEFNDKKTFNIFIAELTNSKEYTYQEKDSNTFVENENRHYNIYNFIPIYLNFDEFINIFFNSHVKYFNISDIISEKIKLTNQYFENINNQIEPFVISNAIKKIYTKKNNYNEMDANTFIEIEKETNDYISLYNFNYITNSLNLDEILNIINKNNIGDIYEIKIKIKVYYQSKKTDIPCIMYFNYVLQNIN